MVTKFKIIKKKEFTTTDAQTGVHYTVGYKGRVYGLNTLRFQGESDDAIQESDNNNVLTVKCDIELKKQIVERLDEVKTYVEVVPKLDLKLSEV